MSRHPTTACALRPPTGATSLRDDDDEGAHLTAGGDKAALQAVARPGLLRATRARVLPVVLGPALAGSAYAWSATGRFSWAWFGLILAGAVAGHLGFNLLQDAIDDASGADDAARADLLSVPTSSGAISAAFPQRRAIRNGIALVAVALGCGIALSLARAPEILPLGATAFAVALAAVVPPVRFGSRVPGSAEAAAVVAAMLQSTAAYAAQARTLDLEAIRIGLVPGLLIASVVFHQQFLRYRSDLALRRPSTVSRLGPHRATAASIVVLAAPFAVLVAHAALGVWPAVALVALVAFVPGLLAWVRVKAEIGPLDNFLTLFGATLGAAAVANALLVLALVLEGVRR